MILSYIFFLYIAELAITSLISKRREWNNCFIKFLKLQIFEERNTSEKKPENSSEIEKKRDGDAMLCNTLWSDRRRLITQKKTFLACSHTSKRRH